MKTIRTFAQCLAFGLFIAAALEAFGMSRRLPSEPPEAPSQPTTPTPVVPREPAAIKDPMVPEGYDPFRGGGEMAARDVDDRYQKYRELQPRRDAGQAWVTDRCDVNLSDRDSFADRIAYAVHLKMRRSIPRVEYVGSLFGMSSDPSTYTPVSLISHPLCMVSRSTLEVTLGGKNIPSQQVIDKANAFASKMNQYRREALEGKAEGYAGAHRLWSKFMMCLSYMESLTTADTPRSENIAAKYAPSGYRRPAGVNFYEDPNQPPASRLNIGLFQFTPNAGGNIQSCIREWNDLYPSCQISRTASQAELIRILGSSLQTFNSFCAVSKVTGMFGVQINTQRSYNTHPANVKSDGSLKSPAERCVSPHINVGRSYNHFAPFQNGSGFTLDTILSCTMAGE